MCSVDDTDYVPLISGAEDEQEDSRAGETERRAQTDRAAAVLSVTVCLSDQRLAVDAQMTAHITLHYSDSTTRAAELFTGKCITAHSLYSDLLNFFFTKLW